MAASFIASAIASLGLAATYAFGGQPQLEGVLLGVALGGIALGFVVWAKTLMPGGDHVQERAVTMAEPSPAPSLAESAAGPADVDRRRFLTRVLAVAAGALGLAALFPVRSLGQRPGTSLTRTAWTRGARAVSTSGIPIRPEELDVGAVVTVFPQGHTDAADSQALLIRLSPGSDADGLVAFSKICTHAGCPVGLYQPTTKELFCPCHQSVFDAGADARPTAGPATRALPKLGLSVDADGYVIATGDFSEPVGPAFVTLTDA